MHRTIKKPSRDEVVKLSLKNGMELLLKPYKENHLQPKQDKDQKRLESELMNYQWKWNRSISKPNPLSLVDNNSNRTF